MTPLPDGSPTAAELDRAVVAEQAYNAARGRGCTHDEATAAARTAAREHGERQFLRSLGCDV